MNKIVVGVIVGACLGLIDGLTAWFTPAVRPFILSILIGSTFKGIVVGVLCGFIANKFRSAAICVAAGAVLGLLFAYLIASMPSATGEHYYLQIMVPGFIIGALIGFLTQRLGTSKRALNAPTRSL